MQQGTCSNIDSPDELCYLLNLLALSYTPQYAVYSAAYVLLCKLRFANESVVQVCHISGIIFFLTSGYPLALFMYDILL